MLWNLRLGTFMFEEYTTDFLVSLRCLVSVYHIALIPRLVKQEQSGIPILSNR